MANEQLQQRPRRPRILVTGFSAFPGAAINPTEHLMQRLAGEASLVGAQLAAEVTTAVLPCTYAGAPLALERLGHEVAPHIHLALGLSRKAEGFVLEHCARNYCMPDLVDAAGQSFGAGPIKPGAADIVASDLPLDAMALALAREQLPVACSTDAGGYLCNYVFYLSAGGHIPSLDTDLSGFVHVPQLLEDGAPSGSCFTHDMLWRGMFICLSETVHAWQRLDLATSSPRVHI